MKVDRFSAAALFALFLFQKMATGQSLRGSVRDAATGIGIPLARIVLTEKLDSPLVAETADLTGGFRLKAPRPGVFSLKISQLGFETRILPEVELGFGKELVLEIQLKETPGQLPAVEVRPDRGDGRLPTAGLHLLTRDAVLRQPATFFDPARLAQSLPGVSNDDQNNGLSIRGLSPSLFQYRIEGLEVVNPNHLSNAGTISDLPTAASGGVSMLSAQMLGNSAIYTGATPIDMGNSVGGLMDIRLRPGNADHFEGTAQAGLVGLDASVEGPFFKKTGGSFLTNYRYSTVGLLEKLSIPLGDETVNFQDLSASLKVPVGRDGAISAFAVMGESSNYFDGKTTGQQVDKDFQNIRFDQRTGIGGLVFHNKLGKTGRLEVGYAISATKNGRIMRGTIDSRSSGFRGFLYKYSSRVGYSNQLTKRVRLEVGGEMVQAKNHLELYQKSYPQDLAGELFDLQPRELEYRFRASTSIELARNISLDGGLRVVVSDRPGLDSVKWELQPVVNLLWKIGPRTGLSAAAERTSQPVLNGLLLDEFYPRGLRSWKFSGQLTQLFLERNRLYLSGFYQKIGEFPVTYTYRSINSPLDWTDFLESWQSFQLTRAEQKGAEAGLSRPLSGGWFLEMNASLFDAREGFVGDTVHWAPTRFNSRWTANVVVGREWARRFVSGNSRSFGINLRGHGRGGFREKPIDEPASQEVGETIFFETLDNPLRLPNYYRADLRLYWKKNRANRTGTLALDVQNVTNRLNTAWHYYDPFLQKIEAKKGLGLVPILSYRLEFRQRERG